MGPTTGWGLSAEAASGPSGTFDQQNKKMKSTWPVILCALYISACVSVPNRRVSAVAEFLSRIEKLDLQDGAEFPTDQAAMTLSRELPFMLSITQSDMDNLALQQGLNPEDCDIYPLFALSCVLADHQECRQYVQRHFSAIQHPDLKLTWAYLCIRKRQETPEMKRYLREALNSKPPREWLDVVTTDPEWTTISNRLNSIE